MRILLHVVKPATKKKNLQRACHSVTTIAVDPRDQEFGLAKTSIGRDS